MKIAPVADLKAHLSTYLKESQEGPIIVTRNGKPVAVLISVQDDNELESLILSYSPKFKAILESGKRQVNESDELGYEEF